MSFLVALAIPVLLIWAIVVCRSNRWEFLKPWLTLQNLVAVSLISGCCLGYEFYHVSVGPIPATIDRAFWGAMICLFGFFVYKNQIRVRAFNHLDLCVLGLFLFIAFSTFSHDWRYRGNEPMGRLLFFNLMPVGFYLVARNIRFEAKHFQQAFWLFSVFGIYLALTAIAEVRGWSFLVWPRYIANPAEAEFFGRARGPMMNPVANGMVMMFALGSTIILWPKDPKKLKQRVYVGLVSLLLIVGVVATMTRSVWLGLPVIFFALIWLPAPTRLRGAMAIGAMVVVALGISLFGSKFNSFQRDKYVTASEMSESASLRPMLAFVAFKMFEDRPIMGLRLRPIHQIQTGLSPGVGKRYAASKSPRLHAAQHCAFLSHRAWPHRCCVSACNHSFVRIDGFSNLATIQSRVSRRSIHSLLSKQIRAADVCDGRLLDDQRNVSRRLDHSNGRIIHVFPVWLDQWNLRTGLSATGKRISG